MLIIVIILIQIKTNQKSVKRIIDMNVYDGVIVGFDYLQDPGIIAQWYLVGI